MDSDKIICEVPLPESICQFDSLVRMIEAYKIPNLFKDPEAQEDIFCFIAGVVGLPGNVNEVEAGLLLSGALLQFKDSPEKFCAALVVIHVLEKGHESFVDKSKFSEFYEYSQPKEILDEWVDFKIQMCPHPSAPLHERRSLDSYLKGQSELDFVMIYDFADSIDRGCGFTSNRLFGPLARHLFFSDNAKYFKLLELKYDLFDIRILISEFSEIKKLNISKISKNILAKFECIRQVIYFRRKNDPISQELTNLIAECILSIAEISNKIFEDFLNYFLRYPVRCPDFFTSLGLSVTTMNEQQLAVLVKIIPINFEQQNDIQIYSRFLESMAKNTPKKIILAILSDLFIRRQEFLKKTERPTVNEPRYTNLGDFQINYLTNIPLNQYCEFLEDLFLQLSTIRIQWYSSDSDYNNNLWAIISEIELASLAFTSIEDHQIKNYKIKLNELVDRYLNISLVFDLVQHSRYEYVIGIINKIRNNFLCGAIS